MKKDKKPGTSFEPVFVTALIENETFPDFSFTLHLNK